MGERFVVGMDLGTTNCVLAYAPLEGDEPQIELLRVPQLVAAGTVEAHWSLPSFLYLAEEHHSGGGALDMPWAAGRRFAVGQYARDQAAEAPERSVSAAKSWLCHSRVDRRQPILPWNAPDAVAKISPVAATQRYLEHLAAAWDAQFPGDSLADQLVVLTVPASFDAVACELTREAALAAGLPQDLVLLEEPQAAVYSWLTCVGQRWRRRLKLGDRLLVCDVGGGTTDLTLIGVDQEEGELVLRRIAVGNHLLVGGDNMDLTLAHFVAQQFARQGVDLDPWQSVALWHSCRAAKERLLSADGPPRCAVAVLGRGSRLIGGTLSVDVDRSAAAELLSEGFFPQCQWSDRPQQRRASGFQEIGLPFESDTAVTRHLAAFLAAHAGADEDAGYPTHVLFNGGVFRAELFRRRLLDVISRWRDAAPVEALEDNDDLDHAVARGAAYYGWSKRRGGVRIRGGIARSYYVGVETAGLAIPGAARPLRALCVAPFGMEEGSELDVPSQEIGLVLGEQAHFRFFSSAVRKQDQPGQLLRSWSEGELVETDSLETTLPAAQGLDEPYVPVRFQSRITELGVFELWCVGARQEGRWKLEFSVRSDEAAP